MCYNPTPSNYQARIFCGQNADTCISCFWKETYVSAGCPVTKVCQTSGQENIGFEHIMYVTVETPWRTKGGGNKEDWNRSSPVSYLLLGRRGKVKDSFGEDVL